VGLSITAYSKASLLPKHERTDHCYDEHVIAFAYSCFPRSYRGLADADVVTGENIGDRCYDVSGSERHRFDAGSYTGYNVFRDMLSTAFLGVEATTVFKDPEQYVDAPFFELINFADNEGAIGPDAAADLVKDFEDGRSHWADYVVAKLSDHAMKSRYYLEKYEDWAHACRLAADHGLIDFH
jgi:hypothetical protein